MRLIDADALKEIFLQDRCGDNFLPKHFVISTINNAPTVESEDNAIQYTKGYQDVFLKGKKLAERPKGEWIDHWSEDLQKMGFRQCSKCKAGCQIYEYGTRKSDLSWIDGQQYTLKKICNFCPNCGARMEVITNENND